MLIYKMIGRLMPLVGQHNSRKPALSFFITGGLLCSMLLAGCSQLQISSSDPSEPEQILFVGHADGDLDIYLTNLRTEETKKLTHNDRDDMHPAWSPDGAQIAYTSSAHGTTEIYVVNADGTGSLRLTNNEFMDFNPVWSADGKSIIYVSSQEGGERLLQLDIDTGKSKSLIEEGKSGTFPQVSSNGKWLAYVVPDGKKRNLIIAPYDAPHSEHQSVKNVAISSYQWSPDSTQIVFSGRTKRKDNIYLLNVETGEQTQLTDTPQKSLGPVWLSNAEIAFINTDKQYGRGQVFRMNISDKRMVKISNSGLEEMHITAAPGGKHLAFVRFENRFFHTYILNLESGDEVKVAKDYGRTHLTPGFQPTAVH